MKRRRRWPAKIGTGPGTSVVLCNAPEPRAGRRVKFKEVWEGRPERNQVWETGIIDRMEYDRLFICRF